MGKTLHPKIRIFDLEGLLETLNQNSFEAKVVEIIKI